MAKDIEAPISAESKNKAMGICNEPNKYNMANASLFPVL